MYRFLGDVQMHMLPLSEFRANASAMLDLVEQGVTVRIMRHGKPVADLVPVPPQADSRPSYHAPFEPLMKLPAGYSAVVAVAGERGSGS